MFIVDLDPQFTHAVKVKVPVDGGHKEETFKATFRVIPTDEMGQYDLSDGESSAVFLRRAIVSMSELVDRDKEPLSYNDDLRDELLRRPYVRSALARTYFEAVTGAKSGN
ncbi:hypothetical protein HHL26_04605 [Sphingobium sp. TB-6]|uniref:hypothetical protein n=1 Tax=Sphingobium sp. TB-6 TaxID=2728850 RepID=UPI00146BDC1D|nr:hypothetical protein [Sphingobium sp. TB-6]NML88346.1 hypothetical protein [Sphingobium sp. TB-6]